VADSFEITDDLIARSDEPGNTGWGFFVDLWTDNGPARSCTSSA
jgi:hypothetical protein